MEPLNTQERTVALFKFLALFLVTVILICWAMYYDWGIPNKQLKLLKEENAQLSAANENTRKILVTIDTIRSCMNRYPTDLNKPRLEMEINEGARQLIKYVGTDTSNFSKIVTRMADSYNQHLIDKKALLSIGNCSDKVADLEKTIKDQKDEIKDLEDDVDDLRLKLKTASNF